MAKKEVSAAGIYQRYAKMKKKGQIKEIPQDIKDNYDKHMRDLRKTNPKIRESMRNAVRKYRVNHKKDPERAEVAAKIKQDKADYQRKARNLKKSERKLVKVRQDMDIKDFIEAVKAGKDV